MNRRDLLLTSSAVGGIAAALQAQPEAPTALIDTNVSIGRWPFRQLPLEGATALAAKLRAEGVIQAWAGHFDALLHRDLSAVNERLATECRAVAEDLLIPIGTVNPSQPGWEEDLRRCAEVHRMPGIRLHPNYHGYSLADPAFGSLLELATARGLFVQISLIMEEERTIHPLVNVPPVDPSPLLHKSPKARVQLLNAFRTVKGQAAIDLARAGVRFEMATLEGVAAVANLLAQFPEGNLLFGSHAPFFYFESAKLKLRESGLSPAPFADAARSFRGLA
jgi:predicted TIM-barrel fold metal-dependent hydrolase